MKIIQQLKQRAKNLKTEIHALYLAYGDPRVPWYAKILVACIVAYAISPIDLIPDFIPIIGYLDDLILLPLGITIAIKMIPPKVMAEYRIKAQAKLLQNQPVNWIVASIVLVIWIVAATWLIMFVFKLLSK